MQTLTPIILTLIPVFGIIFIGAWTQKRELLPSNTGQCLNQFVYWFSLPMLLFHIMATSNDAQVALLPILGCVLGLLCMQALISCIFKLLKYSWKDSIIAGLVVSFPNMAFMGMPVVFLLYPDDSMVSAVVGLTVLTPTINLVISDVVLAMLSSEDETKGTSSKKLWINISRNPPLLGASLGLLVSLVGISLPEALLNIPKMIGQTAAPCALFCMGISIKTQLSNWSHGIKINWKAQGIMLGSKLMLTPFIVYFLAHSMGASDLGLSSIVILVSMPTAVICHIIAIKHDAMAEECANSILIGTLFSVFTLPIVISLVI